MMLGGMMFSGVISKIGIAGFPVDMELVLANAIAEPVKTHVHCFGAALDNSVSEYAGGTLVGGPFLGEWCAWGRRLWH
jgi:hypothetical protein